MFKRSLFALLASVTTINLGIAKAIPQNMDNTMTTASNSLTGCSANYDGQFGLAWVGAYEFVPVSLTSFSSISQSTSSFSRHIHENFCTLHTFNAKNCTATYHGLYDIRFPVCLSSDPHGRDFQTYQGRRKHGYASAQKRWRH